MIFVCVVIVVAAPDNLQELRDIYAQEAADRQRSIADLRRQSHEICCSCGWKNYYPTPGRAKMGLSGHQRWCRK
jgi:hypothetical protein